VSRRPWNGPVGSVLRVFLVVLELIQNAKLRKNRNDDAKATISDDRAGARRRRSDEYPTAELLNAAIRIPCATSGKRSRW
jgi:hypothetical protein